jgi:hypothetical protein
MSTMSTVWQLGPRMGRRWPGLVALVGALLAAGPAGAVKDLPGGP